jgi:sec-independent protein translocase protein TatB
MFDFGLGSSELLFIAIVALIVIGPKDLPRLLRTIGQYMRKIQGMAREFQTHLNEAAKEAGVDDVSKEVKNMTNFTVTADLDKQGAEIKRAIESSAPKPVNSAAPKPADATKSEGKAEGEPNGKREPARIESPKTSPAAVSKPAAQAELKSQAKPKALPSQAEVRPKAKQKAEAKPKPATKAETRKKPERAPER